MINRATARGRSDSDAVLLPEDDRSPRSPDIENLGGSDRGRVLKATGERWFGGQTVGLFAADAPIEEKVRLALARFARARAGE
jgi:hypothetical protein